MLRSLLAAGVAAFMSWSGAAAAQSALGPGAAHGQQLYNVECTGCHSLQDNRIGPRHCWLIGRHAASEPDYTYSAAMKDSGIVWNDKTLGDFLTSPFTYVSGTTMGYAGIDDPKDRADVIAYLKQATMDPAICGAVKFNRP